MSTFTSAGHACLPNTQSYQVDGPFGPMLISVAAPHVPDEGLSLMQANRPWPVVYIVDANLMFGALVDQLRMLQFSGHVPPCLMVGIGYPDFDLSDFSARRTLELTPTKWSSPWSSGEVESGGADATLAFLKDHVKAFINQRYPTDPDISCLAGLSFGGLFTLYARAQAEPKFTHHIALSPSLFWDDRLVLKLMQAGLESEQPASGRLYVAAGSLEMEITPPDEPEMVTNIQMVQNVVSLGTLCATHRDLIEAKVEILSGESHHSIMGPGLTRGLRYIFQDPYL
ncbi:MAG: alpha/beta hydrolase-fold protein [Pseudomonadota bacterium]